MSPAAGVRGDSLLREAMAVAAVVSVLWTERPDCPRHAHKHYPILFSENTNYETYGPGHAHKHRSILCQGEVAYLYLSVVAVDAPAVLLCSVYALCVSIYAVDIHGHDRVVGVYVHVVHIVGRTWEYISVSSLYEAFASLALLLEVYLPPAVGPFWVDDKGIITVR